MKISILILTLFTGCSSSYQLATTPGDDGISFEELQKAVEGEYTIITFRDSVKQGLIHHARQDSIIYEEWSTSNGPGKQPMHSVPFSQVSRIQFKDRLKGLTEWGAAGAATGTVVMTAVWAGFPKANPIGVVLLGIITGSVIGGPIGAITGFFVGHKFEYRLWKDSEVKQSK